MGANGHRAALRIVGTDGRTFAQAKRLYHGPVPSGSSASTTSRQSRQKDEPRRFDSVAIIAGGASGIDREIVMILAAAGQLSWSRLWTARRLQQPLTQSRRTDAEGSASPQT